LIWVGWGRLFWKNTAPPQTINFKGLKITHEGYTESGIRVHGVIDERDFVIYPCVWQNAILIKV